MAVTMAGDKDRKLLSVVVTEKLSKEDYEKFVPAAEDFIREAGKIKVLFEMRDFGGWEMGALWEDIKFDVKHFKDIEKLAMLGDKKWEKGMSVFCKPFTTASVRYFDLTERGEALKWLDGE